MHEFLLSQLDQIIEGDENAIHADNCFSRAMQSLYESSVPKKFTDYYEKLYQVANHAQKQRQTLRMNKGVVNYEADQYGRRDMQ